MSLQTVLNAIIDLDPPGTIRRKELATLPHNADGQGQVSLTGTSFTYGSHMRPTYIILFYNVDSQHKHVCPKCE